MPILEELHKELNKKLVEITSIMVSLDKPKVKYHKLRGAREMTLSLIDLVIETDKQKNKEED